LFHAAKYKRVSLKLYTQKSFDSLVENHLYNAVNASIDSVQDRKVLKSSPVKVILWISVEVKTKRNVVKHIALSMNLSAFVIVCTKAGHTQASIYIFPSLLK
jgi:hypothetical protein